MGATLVLFKTSMSSKALSQHLFKAEGREARGYGSEVGCLPSVQAIQSVVPQNKSRNRVPTGCFIRLPLLRSVWMRLGTRLPKHVYKGQRLLVRVSFFPSPIWVLRIELEWSGMEQVSLPPSHFTTSPPPVL